MALCAYTRRLREREDSVKREREREGLDIRARKMKEERGEVGAEVWGFDSTATDNASGSSQEIHGRGAEINVLLHLHSYLSCLHILSRCSLLFRFYIRAPPLERPERQGRESSVRCSLFEQILAQTSATRGRSRRLASQPLGKSLGCDLRDVLRILEGFQVAGLGRSVLFFGRVLVLWVGSVDQGRVT